jgi:hypothetical protein
LPCEENDDVLTGILTGNERDFIKIKVFFKKVWKNEEECCIIEMRYTAHLHTFSYEH